MITLLILLISSQLFILWVYMLFNRKIHVINLETDIYAYSIYFQYSLILTSMLFAITCFLIFKILKPSTTNSFVKQKITEINIFLHKINVMYKAYDIIFKFLGTGSFYVIYTIKLAKIIMTFSKKLNTFIIFCFVSMPRLIILSVFLAEIYNHQLHYYFYSLYFLLLPLFLRLIFAMLEDVEMRVFPEAQAMVVQVMVPINIPGRNFVRIGYHMAPEYQDIDPDQFFPESYFPLLFIKSHINTLKELSLKFSLPTLFVYQFGHIIGFVYILFVIA